jgi:hypothetical protein
MKVGGLTLMAAATLAAATGGTLAPSASAATTTTKHVLYLSVDGLHESDLLQYIAQNPGSNMARLVNGGTDYTNASTTQPSDSFPGTLAAFTGGTPKTTGVYYDDTYDRTLYAPGSNCQGSPGTPVNNDESIDTGATTSTRTILGENIDPTLLPLEKGANGACTPVYPNQYNADNTVFSVAHNAGLYTAYSDKHPAYQAVAGHGTPNSINDLFTPEINADIIPASLTDSRGTVLAFPENSTNNSAPTITDSMGDVESYDQLKVDAILNQIDGLTSVGGATKPKAGTVPAIFGMNFQTVSVGQKLVDPTQSCVRSKNAAGCNPSYVPGGYEPGSLAFTPQLAGGLNHVDQALGRIIDELNAKGLASSTEIIFGAKHGQSPIDPSQLSKIGDILPNAVTAAGGTTVADTSDDVGLLWLGNSSDDGAVASYLNSHQSQYHVATVYQGGTGPYVAGATPLYPEFGFPSKGSLQAARQPDLIVQPTTGTIYSSSGAKVAEHGGFSTNDTHVALVVDQTTPARSAAGTAVRTAAAGTGQVVSTPVQTTQIAPSLLQALGLDYTKLDAVRSEGTVPLPTPAGPTPALPETPVIVVLPVVAVAAGASVLVVRRRRACA